MGAARRLALALIASLGLAGPAVAGGPTQHLILLHTSDIHGSVLPFDDARNRPANGSLAQVGTLVQQIRSAAAGPVLVLDSGDTLQGTPLEQFVHVRWSEPSPSITAMNIIGYQAMAVGNHEFNFGLKVLERAEQQAKFPFLSANILHEDTGKPAFKPYLVIEAGKVRVGILGLTTPQIPGWELPEHYRGLRFEAMDAAARQWVPVLRNDEHCDLVVVLAHTGFERDLKTGRSNGEEAEDYAWRLSEVPGIDVLLTGHTHRNIPPRLLNGVIVSQPASHGRRLTRIDLDLERSEGHWRIVHWQGQNLRTSGVPADQKIVDAIEPLHRRVVAALDGPVGHVTAPVTVKGCRVEDCAALDLIHAVQLDASGAQISLASLLSDRTPDLEPGPVTWRWVYSLYVYPNTLVVVKLTGQQVKDVLEYAARYYDGLECAPGAGCTLLYNPMVRHYNVDSMEGVTYVIDPSAPVGQRVRDLSYHGRPIDLHATFTVVCNNYRAAGGSGFPHLAAAQRVWHNAKEMTDLIGDYLAAHDPWTPRADGNWWLAPRITNQAPLSSVEGEPKVGR
ncbi:MAG: bifunctional metallophosphatase/5'-nucleotidase [Acidobacteria bacterium]|nr:bifunctional metallophosphatase/5'-nucleotidase [Acidobacteriota bacterium]